MQVCHCVYVYRCGSSWHVLVVVEMAEKLCLDHSACLYVSDISLPGRFLLTFSTPSPGFLNSVAGIISTLSSVYGAQGGMFGGTEKSAIIVTGSLALVWGTLMLVYEYGFLRNLKLEHDEIAGIELAGKHGEGVLVVEEDVRNGRA